MGLLFLEWKDIASGVASGAGFAFGGPLGAAILGGAVSGIWTGIERGSWEEGFKAGLVGAAFGAIPGGMVGGAAKGLAGGGLKSLAGGGLKGLRTSFADSWQLATKKGYGNLLERADLARHGLPHLGAGALTAGAGTALGSLWYDDQRPTGMPFIPTKMLVNNSSTEMEIMQMPDMKHPDFPNQYRFLPATESFHTELPTNLGKYYNSFAKDSQEPIPPKGSLIPRIEGPDRANFTNYTETVMLLERAFKVLNESAESLAPLTHKSLEISAKGRQAIDDIVVIVNSAAGAIPQGGMTEDDHIFAYVTQALQEGDRMFKEAMMQQEDLSKRVDGESEKLKTLEDRLSQLQQGSKDLQQRSTSPADITLPSWVPPGGAAPSYVDPSAFPTGSDGIDGLGGTDGADTPGLDGQAPGEPYNAGNMPSATAPAAPTVQSPAATSPMGSGLGDMMGSMLPMMMQQAMMRSLADQDLNNRRAELSRRDVKDEFAPAVPPPVGTPATPVTGRPATALPSTIAPTTQQHGHPSVTAPAAQTVRAPGRTPEADGSVIYAFPDGRTQKVSVTVAQALDAAFGNASSTDAQKAYEKTTAKWSDKKQIGDRADPYQLMTGDVATWDQRSAILVVFGSEEGGTLEAIINGEMKPFTSEMSDSAGEFGQFTGFAHPKGIELTAPTNGNALPTESGAVDHPGNAAISATASPVS
ncbi:hypothetical protein [Nocardia sp. NPDC047038]|uniref:hypothetical protein n=1 Tax=Nocardia sp. NPDC047038 TaxID=3154338 RepID=UPI0033DB75AA